MVVDLTPGIKIPTIAPTVLATLQARVAQLQQTAQESQREASSLIEAGCAYAASVGLKANANYRFEMVGEQMVAKEIEEEEK